MGFAIDFIFDMEQIITIEGPWAGSYGYGGGRLPVEFEASFEFQGNPSDFTGLIRDNGPLGDAHVRGQQLGRNVSFTKFYISPFTDAATSKVAYTGVLSEDGNSISGRWKLGIVTSGPWEVFRSNPLNVVPNGNIWPPPVATSAAPQYSAPELNRKINLLPMTTQQFGGQLTLAKPRSPQAVGQTLEAIGMIVILAFLIAFFGWELSRLIHLGAANTPYTTYKALIYSGFGIFALSQIIYRWYKIIRYGDIYILDRDKNRISRNSRPVGSFNEIWYVEIRATGIQKSSNTVTIVTTSHKRIFVETGAPSDTTELANTIAQFVGVQVVQAA
jgi:hypothetical protein